MMATARKEFRAFIVREREIAERLHRQADTQLGGMLNFQVFLISFFRERTSGRQRIAVRSARGHNAACRAMMLGFAASARRLRKKDMALEWVRMARRLRLGGTL